MQFQAVSIGQAVPRENFDAMIQSVFDSAVNLRLMHQDRLITVLLSDHYELPQGIRLVIKNVPLNSLAIDQQAAVRGGVLRFASSALSIDLRSAPVWVCPIRNLNTDMNAPFVQEAWMTVWSLLNKRQRLHSTDIVAGDLFQSDSGSALSQKMSKPVMQLMLSTGQFNIQASLQAARDMIGLGPGVTPSGDDILIGFFAGLWSLVGESQARLTFIQSFGRALMSIATSTNEISRTYLYHATQGQFSSSLSDLARALAKGGDLEETAQATMHVGHSSGMDSITGFLIGLRAWNQLAPVFTSSPRSSRAEVRPLL